MRLFLDANVLLTAATNREKGHPGHQAGGRGHWALCSASDRPANPVVSLRGSQAPAP